MKKTIKPQKGIILSANFGGYDPEIPWPEQNPFETIPFSIARYNDGNFPGRELALTPRMKPALIKMFGWDIVPDYDFYIWADASKTIISPDFGAFMLGQLGKADIAIFKHPERNSIQEEGNQYLLSRYQGEYLDEQWERIRSDKTFKDQTLYASTGFAYRPTPKIKAAFKEWWYHKTRYLLHDQLALPYVLQKAKVKVNIIDENIYKFPLWEHTRKRRRG
jgi:hypothetical protein